MIKAKDITQSKIASDFEVILRAKALRAELQVARSVRNIFVYSFTATALLLFGVAMLALTVVYLELAYIESGWTIAIINVGLILLMVIGAAWFLREKSLLRALKIQEQIDSMEDLRDRRRF